MSFYKRIRGLREDCDLTQRQVAKDWGIAQNTLSQYENGQRNIPNDILVKAARYYGTSIDYLLGLTNDPTPSPKNRKKQ